MLKKTLLFTLVIVQTLMFGQKKIDELVEQQQYLSAWKEIEKLPKNPENLNYTTNFVLTYFTLSKAHQEFSFNNLNADENLIEKRYTVNPQTAKFFHVPLDTILLNAIQKFPSNGELHISLGNYYFDVFLLYKKKWLVNRQELMRLFKKHYSKAHELKKYSDKSFYGLGFFEMFNGNNLKAIDYFEKSLELNSKNINSLHQLAVLYSETALKFPENEKYFKNAVDYSKKTLETFPVSQKNHLANVAFTIGNLYQQNNNLDSAIVYYLLSDSYLPEEKDVLENLLICFIQKKRWKEAGVTTSKILNMELKDVIMFQNIMGIYEFNEANDKLIEILKTELKMNVNDKERTGYLKLYLASVYFGLDKTKSKEWLKESEKDFNICYDLEHPVFLSINKLNAQLNK